MDGTSVWSNMAGNLLSAVPFNSTNIVLDMLLCLILEETPSFIGRPWNKAERWMVYEEVGRIMADVMV